MNIIKKRRLERLEKIEFIEKLIKRKNIDKKELWLLCCSKWGITERTAKELIEIAYFNIKEA